MMYKDRELVYRAGGGNDFLADVRTAKRAAYAGEESAARSRLLAHKQQMLERDANTASFAGLVVPQYLTDELETDVWRGPRPASVVRRLTMPAGGDEVRLPWATTGPQAEGEQELEAGKETDPVLAELVLPVRTVRGVVDQSFESEMRGVDMADHVVAMLADDIRNQIDKQIITGGVVAGNVNKQVGGLLKANVIKAANVKTDADHDSPTRQMIWQELVRTKSVVDDEQPATAILMHTDRWNMILNDWGSGGPTAANWTDALWPQTIIVPTPYIPDDYGTADDQDVLIALHGPSAVLLESPLVILTGSPDLRKWTLTTQVARYIAFGLRRDTHAAATYGTIFDQASRQMIGT